MLSPPALFFFFLLHDPTFIINLLLPSFLPLLLVCVCSRVLLSLLMPIVLYLSSSTLSHSLTLSCFSRQPRTYF